MTERWLSVRPSSLALLLAAMLAACAEPLPPPPHETPEYGAPDAVENPPPADGGLVVRSGETSAGRSFYVRQIDQNVTLMIAGEQEVSLFGCGWSVNIGSIVVDELPDPPELVHVHWICDWYFPTVDESFGNLVFARGAAETALLRDCSPKLGGDRWGCHRLRGRHDLTYADTEMSIIEGYTQTNAFCTWGTADCSATETQLTRRWEVSSSTWTLLTCEKLRRAVSPPLVTGQGCPDVYALLAATPWTPQAMSAEERAQRCQALGGGL